MKLYYKYLPKGRLTYLDDELLRFTQPIDLNDPFECLPQEQTYEDQEYAIEAIASELLNFSRILDDKPNLDFANAFRNEITEYLESIKNDERNLFKKAYEAINKEIGIFSLSQNWNNTLMWSHYTDAHKGFCVGFDSQDDYFQNYLSEDRTESKFIDKVIYSEARVKIPMKFNEPKLKFEPYLTKSLDWKYEEEIRVISTLNLSDKVYSQIPIDVHLFKVPHSMVKEIILGARISENDANEIKVFCMKHRIDLYQSKISDEKFDMERDKIN